MMVSVTARLRARDGQAQALEALLRELADQVRANEPGCLLYQAARSKHDPSLYLVLERYADEAALAAHSNSEHFRERVSALIELCEGTPEIALFDEL
jgi:quinol monooxygenase YgiN